MQHNAITHKSHKKYPTNPAEIIPPTPNLPINPFSPHVTPKARKKGQRKLRGDEGARSKATGLSSADQYKRGNVQGRPRGFNPRLCPLFSYPILSYGSFYICASLCLRNEFPASYFSLTPPRQSPRIHHGENTPSTRFIDRRRAFPPDFPCFRLLDITTDKKAFRDKRRSPSRSQSD